MEIELTNNVQLWRYTEEWLLIDRLILNRVPGIGEVYRHYQDHEGGHPDYEVVNVITDPATRSYGVILYPIEYDEAGLPSMLSELEEGMAIKNPLVSVQEQEQEERL